MPIEMLPPQLIQRFPDAFRAQPPQPPRLRKKSPHHLHSGANAPSLAAGSIAANCRRRAGPQRSDFGNAGESLQAQLSGASQNLIAPCASNRGRLLWACTGSPYLSCIRAHQITTETRAQVLVQYVSKTTTTIDAYPCASVTRERKATLFLWPRT